MARCLITFCFTLLVVSVFGQDAAKDSLKTRIQQEEVTIEKAMAYAELAGLYQAQHQDSAIYYANKGLQYAEQHQFQEAVGENLAKLGDIYVRKNLLDQARVYYTRSLEFYNAKEHPFDHAQISMIVGNIHLAQSKYIDALETYQASLEVAIEQDFDELVPHLYNNIGNLYLDIDDLDDALSNFTIAYEFFLEAEDEYNAAFSLANISLIKKRYGENDTAVQGYLDVVRLFSKNNNWADMAWAYNEIANLYLEQDDLELAEEFLSLSLSTLDNESGAYEGPSSIFKSKVYTTAAVVNYRRGRYTESSGYARKALNMAQESSLTLKIIQNAKILGDIYDREQRADSALYFNKIYIEANEAFKIDYDLKRITQIKMQHAFDQILTQREIEEVRKEAEYKQKELIYIGVSVGTLLLVGILVLLYFNLKSKNAQMKLQQEKLELEKEQLNRDVEYRKKELASNMMYLIEKNEFISNIARKLIDLKPNTKKDLQGVIQNMINELKSNSSNKIWDEFELRFKEVHSDFYDELHKKHPNLTPNEIKLCAFLRLNMSTKEISSITYQTVKSINMARFRLRKKLDIEQDEHLVNYLSQL